MTSIGQYTRECCSVKMEPIIALVKGKKIEIPLGLRIPQMDNFEDFENWLNLERTHALGLKKRLESGEISEDCVQGEMIYWSIRTKNEFKKVKLLRIEERLIYLNLEIRVSLTLSKPNPERCVELLKELNDLNFTSVMLLKNPEVVDTIDFVTRYEREISEASSSSSRPQSRSQQAKIVKESEEIKKMASRIIRKFRELFQVPDEKSFSEVFKEKQMVFVERTAEMEELEILIITDNSFLG